jgi:hypothetical protein
MDIPEKLKMIELFIDAVKFEIIKKVKDMPKEWDEIELRWYITDMFKKLGKLGSQPEKPAERLRKYNDAIISMGLF